MPIDVLWEEMAWEATLPGCPTPTRPLRIVRDEYALLEGLLSEVPGETLPFLRFISRETVTVFHQQNLAQLQAELAVLAGTVCEPDAARHLEAVRRLVAESIGTKDSLIAFRVRAAGDGLWSSDQSPNLPLDKC